MQAIESAINQVGSFKIKIFILFGGGYSLAQEKIDIILKNHANVNYIDNSQVQGIAHNWNYAILNCQTPFFSILHQDDMLEKNYVQLILENFIMHNEWSICYCDNNTIDENGKIKKRLQDYFFRLLRKHEISQKTAKPLLKYPIITCPTVVYKTDDVRSIGLFSYDYKNELDWEFFLRTIALGKKIGYINRKLYNYRRHLSNESNKNKKNLIQFKECQKIFEKYYENYPFLYNSNGIYKRNLYKPLNKMLYKYIIIEMINEKKINKKLLDLLK